MSIGYQKKEEGNISANGVKRRFAHWHKIMLFLVLYDIIAVSSSYFLALWLRFDCIYSKIPEKYMISYALFIPFYAAACVLIFWRLRLYKSIWRFASYTELSRVSIASLVTSALHIVGITAIFGRMPFSYYLWGMGFQFMLILGIRFSYRFVLLSRRREKPNQQAELGRVMLIGAGDAGQMILRDLNRSDQVQDKVYCMIDDNPNKWDRTIDGVCVAGGRDNILACVEKYQINKIYLAIPSASAEDKRDILSICNETSCELKKLPGMYQIVNGEVTASAMKEVSVEDLLGREPIRANLEEVFDFLYEKVILVTGGGGSIGSELCRQIAAHQPKQLIIFEVYENNAYDIQLELKDKYPDLNLEVLIGSVRDSRRINQVFETYKPDVVYHAAAHKHVPLMEDSPCESIKNNAIGTYKTAYAAMMHGCQRFVLVSTDKAVNPTNIMGASKRLCEMIIQSFDAKIKTGKWSELPKLYTHAEDEYGEVVQTYRFPKRIRTEFVAVRFGNVLGSNGSVIPLFKKQIENGGPVTVTHPDIIRYFMTIPEAVSLVLQAGTYARGGEIFVLDMGSPVKIDTLARNLIKLSGYQPDRDIQITYTGLRSGEKLYEEKLMAEEGLKKTSNKLIHIGCPIPFDTDQFLRHLNELMDAAYANRVDVRELVMKTVTTYHPAKIDVDVKEEKEISFESPKSAVVMPRVAVN